MASGDFAEVVEPWLNMLNENPECPPLPEDLSTTTSPIGAKDLEGQILQVDLDDEFSLIPELALAEEDIEAAREALRVTGIDVLAFYKSFRFRDRPPYRDKWGIFLIDAGVSAVEAEYTVLAAGLPRDELRKLAIDTLVAHERYHFWIDVWALGQEVLPITNRIKRYECYLAARIDGPFDYEESLANHYAYSRL